MEKVLLPVRWWVVGIIIIGLSLLSWSQHQDLVLFLILIGMVYNSLILIMNRRALALNNLFISFVFGGLCILGILVTGGPTSPFLPLISVAFAAFGMRYPLYRAMLLSLFFLVVLAVGYWLTAGYFEPAQIFIYSSLNLLLVWMVNTLVCQAEQQRSRFLQMAIHELRNPITTLKTSLGIMTSTSKKKEDSAHLSQLTKTMEQEVDYLSNLLSDILLAFRVREGRLGYQFDLVDFGEVVRAGTKGFLDSSQPGRISLEIVEGQIPVKGDSKRLEEVVRNLVENALKYSPNDTTVSIRLSRGESEAALSVKDQGIGIPVDQYQAIFREYYRASNADATDSGGLGLGLYICRDIIEKHGGRLWVESELGSGSVFQVRLPLSTNRQ